MKKREVIFCLDKKISEMLDSEKEKTGIPKSRIVQDALKKFFDGGQNEKTN
ncbi:MAG: ribbon-helix-helix domain-containing protein [Candidatus Aenigmarchaeota archaeon]|nr:ribbon-helix-helix domain-containing protein [Candidatus Aenigmarchaeota archaeon]